MTEAVADAPAIRRPDLSEARLSKRYSAERRFRLLGQLAILSAVAMLGLLVFSIASKAIPAFTQSYIALDIVFDGDKIDPEGTRERNTLRRAD